MAALSEITIVQRSPRLLAGRTAPRADAAVTRQPSRRHFDVYAIRHFKRKGRGLVATQAIAEGAEIVRCPVILYDDADAGRISKTRLGDYNFRFGERQNRACIVLGVISLCNHADEPNAEISCHEADLMVSLIALRTIAEGEEICIRYRRPLWFTPAA